LKNTRYVFVAQSCDKANNCANSSNQSFLAGRDIKPPFINLSIPRFINRRTLDIRGSTEPFSSVTLFVNNLNAPKRSLSQNEVGSSGRFVFSQMQLEQNNVIKIVMVDKAGNKNEKTFEVGVDTEIPVVQLNEIPSLTSKTNLTISGNVNKPVIIKVFLESKINQSQVTNPPAKITGLNATKVGQNSVELHWNESKDKDFSHYAIYRDGVLNLFIDALVDSGKTYVYEVSAIDIFANEGPKSEPITVATLRNGQILNLNPPQVDILEDFRKPLMIVNVSSPFNFGVKLNKGDGDYNVKLIFEDKADNNVIIEKSVTLDTKKPEVKITSPPSGAFIFENVANNVDIVGKTKPNARVHLFVDRTPFSFFNQTLELSGLTNEVQNLPEAQLDAKCRTTVSASFCRTGADFSVDADGEGNFKFKNVDLTATFGGAGRVREVPVTEFRDTQLEEGRDSKRTTLVVIATDQTGQRGVTTQPVSIGTCWSGNQSWNVIPLTQYQSPTSLSTERFAEGTETIYFFFNYSYIGRGTDAKITGLALSKACGTREILDPRFNISCQVLSSGNSPARLNKEGTLSYSAITLSRFPGMDRFLENDWKDFFKAINKELTFPFQIKITYKHKIIDENGAEKEITETQTTCQEVSYVIDNSIIDPRKVLPDWLLFDFVDFLQDSIKTLNQAQEQINKVLEYVAVGCLVSFGLNLVMQSARRITSFLEEKRYSILNSKTISQLSEFIGVGKITLNPEKREDDVYCQDLVKQI
ncbi:hypothetical protein HYU07_07935, partial [Candidatus Woesearchaeota archaeon]|nr:hypothetical protein [Candidatus Woesearchaeota archaeon]